MKLLRKYLKPKESYSEVFQSRPCRFAFGIPTEDGVLIEHKPVLCRSFLDDTLVWLSGHALKTKDIYGYTYRGKNIPKDYLSLVITEEDGKAPVNLGENLKVLHTIENDLGLKLTEVQGCTDGSNPTALWVKGDNFWRTTTVHSSWYTYLLRCLTDKKANKWEDVKHHMSCHEYDKLHLALKDLEFIQVSGYIDSKDDSDGTMHEYNGFFSQLTGWSKDWFTYAEQLRGLLASK